MKTVTTLLLALLALAACNTIEGAGEDIQGGGEAISDSAADTKQKITN